MYLFKIVLVCFMKSTISSIISSFIPSNKLPLCAAGGGGRRRHHRLFLLPGAARGQHARQPVGAAEPLRLKTEALVRGEGAMGRTRGGVVGRRGAPSCFWRGARSRLEGEEATRCRAPGRSCELWGGSTGRSCVGGRGSVVPQRESDKGGEGEN